MKFHRDTRKLVEIFSFAIERDDQIFEALGEEIPLPEALSRVRDDSIESRAWEAWRGPLIDPLNLDELSECVSLLASRHKDLQLIRILQ